MIITILCIFIIMNMFCLVGFSNNSKTSLALFGTLCLILIAFTGLRDGTKVTDYESYTILFETGGDYIEPTFVLLRYVAKFLLRGDVVVLMCLYALLAIPLKFRAIQSYSEFIFLSLLIWIGNLYLQQDFTQVRASVATGIFLFSLNSLYNQSEKYWVYVIVACLFHISSLLMIPLWLISPYKIKKQMWIGLLIISYIMALYKIDFIDLIGLIPIEHIQSKFEMYKSFQEFGDYSANIFSLLHLSRIILWGLLLWKSDLIFLKNRYVYLLLKIMALSLVALPLFSLNIAAALRIMEYYGIVEIILFPMLLYTIKPTFVSKVILVCFASMAIYMRIFISELIKV